MDRSEGAQSIPKCIIYTFEYMIVSYVYMYYSSCRGARGAIAHTVCARRAATRSLLGSQAPALWRHGTMHIGRRHSPIPPFARCGPAGATDRVGRRACGRSGAVRHALVARQGRSHTSRRRASQRRGSLMKPGRAPATDYVIALMMLHEGNSSLTTRRGSSWETNGSHRTCECWFRVAQATTMRSRPERAVTCHHLLPHTAGLSYGLNPTDGRVQTRWKHRRLPILWTEYMSGWASRFTQPWARPH